MLRVKELDDLTFKELRILLEDIYEMERKDGAFLITECVKRIMDIMLEEHSLRK